MKYSRGAMKYCVGITMATDWGEEGDPHTVDRRLVRRVLGYFRP
jgi:hypothetical protein